ncbi:tyrosine-type recombinase/integrase [Desulfovibrio sp. OttesenSCG-928-C14]|nr:tyrosine-type recombinase/integrase [Desulfovibrio sp. OttesenSCG-928-C14]
MRTRKDFIQEALALGISNTFDIVVAELGFNDGIEDSRQKVVFHTRRHTFASWLVQRGVPLYTVAKLTGHSELRMVERYAHLAPSGVKEAAKMLEGALSRDPEITRLAS